MQNEPGVLGIDDSAAALFETSRRLIHLSLVDSDMPVAGLVVTSLDSLEAAQIVRATLEVQPPIVLLWTQPNLPTPIRANIFLLNLATSDRGEIGRFVETIASDFELGWAPPFLTALYDYMARCNTTFACPGHQGSTFYEAHPTGKQFLDFVGEGVFRMDVPHADPVLGDMSGREGVPAEAEALAARAFGADKTYFVLNGTSTSNKIVTSALLSSSDYVLFDRNNHKSCYNGALVLSRATPVYLETTRSHFGLIGGVPDRCFDEDYIRNALYKISPAQAGKDKPFRLAILQLGTWDGTIYNAPEIVRRIGHLCDYILFDSAWVGYEQFVPIMADASPLRMQLDASSPGIIVTQSVHKQLAGFSQASQIHVRYSHLASEVQNFADASFNSALMLHGTTSPFYPLFASLEVNAVLHGSAGRSAWQSAVINGVEARLSIFENCRHITPFVPPVVNGAPWFSYSIDEIANGAEFFELDPEADWHGFDGYSANIQSLDPCKLLVTTARRGNSADVQPIPSTVLAFFLRENGLVPEKSDLYSILFLVTPSTSSSKLSALTSAFTRFEAALERNDSVRSLIPSLGVSNPRYRDIGIRDLCHTIHEAYDDLRLSTLLRLMFVEEHRPEAVVSPDRVHEMFVGGFIDFVPIDEAAGRIAAEGALPYPPGIFCIAPGERWGGPVLEYFLAVERLNNRYPEFAPFYHGVQTREEAGGNRRLFVYVLK